MSLELKSERVNINDDNVLLISVRGGSASIGVCSAGYIDKLGDASALTKIFYIGNSPVAEILCPNHGSKRCDKLVSIYANYTSVDKTIHEKLTDGLGRLNRGEPPEESLRGVLALLSDGVYTVYPSEYYPTSTRL